MLQSDGLRNFVCTCQLCSSLHSVCVPPSLPGASQVADALRNMDAAFPSAAAPQQPIKLPRQHNVDKDEYREFLNLGHGEIFNLDLDR